MLDAIPEPLPPAQQVPPPPSTDRSRVVASPRTPVRASEAASDTLRVGTPAGDTVRAEAPGDSVSVPVPSPTQPLGNRPAPGLAMPDTLPPPPNAPLPIADPVRPVVPPASAAPGPNEPCWRLQIAAPDESPKAESRRQAGESLLLVPFAVEFQKGLYKVRTRDCMTRAAADALKRRAADSGFEGVFVVDTHAAAVKPAPAPARKSPARPTAKKKPRQ
ncbi:MAG: hypothetical protein ABL977_13095 [Candidatus Eisenbacteria bacterium]